MPKKQDRQDKKEMPKNIVRAKELVNAIYSNDRIITFNTDQARELGQNSGYGSFLEDGRLQLSYLETYYLIEKKKLHLADSRNNEVLPDSFLKKAKRHEKNFWTKYVVFRDIRNRGYIIKTALKFGADFRVYDRGVKPGQDHAKWVLYPVGESSNLTWHEFAAKNRVAHSTKKSLLLAIIDEEGDITYYEVRWLKP